ncbi:MAG: hypothetical protein EBU90_27405 [Proteobacteria bacterium]|nr:hypothetical protein [Pseudomonadota bacterium]
MFNITTEATTTENIKRYSLIIDGARYHYAEYYDDDSSHVCDDALICDETGNAIDEGDLLAAVRKHLDNPHY